MSFRPSSLWENSAETSIAREELKFERHSINFTISPYASSTEIDGNLCWPTKYEQHINSVWNIIKVNCLRPAREFLRWLSRNINNIKCVQYNRARSALQYCCWVRDQCLIWFYRHLALPRLSSLQFRVVGIEFEIHTFFTLLCSTHCMYSFSLRGLSHIPSFFVRLKRCSCCWPNTLICSAHMKIKNCFVKATKTCFPPTFGVLA